MRILGTTLAIVVILGVAGTQARAADKIDKAKLVGTWKVTKGEVPPGASAEFTKDGKVIIKFDENGTARTLEGSYTVDGDKLSVTMKKGDKDDTDTITIKSLSADKLVIENKQGKEVEFEKAK